METMTFMVEHDEDTVTVRWLVHLGQEQYGLARTLETEFDGIRGVESVCMRRYSALLRVANHVAFPSSVATAVVEVLYGKNVGADLRFLYKDPQVDVVLNGQPVPRA